MVPTPRGRTRPRAPLNSDPTSFREPESIRAFVALTPGPLLALSLARIQSSFEALPGSRDVRWTKAEQIHLTLHFFGNITPEQVKLAIQRLHTVTRRFRSFALDIGRLGSFPSLDRPRVIWLGIGGAVDSLLALQSSIAQTLCSLGRPPENRPFHPHLTLGRARTGTQRPALDLNRIGPMARLDPWHVQSVLLMRSELKPHGPIHSLLSSHPLAPDFHPEHCE